MQTLPQLRWLLVIFLPTLASIFTQNGFDILTAIQNPAVATTGLITVILAALKMVAEGMNLIDDEDQYYHTLKRDGTQPEPKTFWQRVW